MPPTDKSRPCARCSCTTVNFSTWVAATDDVRTFWKAAGCRRFVGHGLCSACYAYLATHKRLHEYTRTRFTATGHGRCGRCGVDGGLVAGLCEDCTQVTADLGEQEAWSA